MLYSPFLKNEVVLYLRIWKNKYSIKRQKKGTQQHVFVLSLKWDHKTHAKGKLDRGRQMP